MIYYAHSGTPGDKSNWQTLQEHSLAVAELAAAFAEPLGLGKAAHLAGLLHDLGDWALGADKSIAELVSHLNVQNYWKVMRLAQSRYRETDTNLMLSTDD